MFRNQYKIKEKNIEDNKLHQKSNQKICEESHWIWQEMLTRSITKSDKKTKQILILFACNSRKPIKALCEEG